MIRSVTVSVVFHLAVAGVLVLDLPFWNDPAPIIAENIVTVTFENVGETTNQRTAGTPDEPVPDEPISAPDEERQPPPVAAPPPPPPAPSTDDVAEAPPPPLPDPEPVAEPPVPAPRPTVELEPDGTLAPRQQVEEKVERMARLEPLPLPVAKPVEAPKPAPPPVPKPRPETIAKAPAEVAKPVPEPTPKQDEEALFDRLSAKLDRLNKDKPKPPVEKTERRISDIRIGEGGAARNRVSQVLTVTERDLLRSHMARNWSPNHGAPGIQDMRADVHLFLNPDGTLAQEPKIVEVFDAGQNRRVVRAFTDSAVRAVYKAQPLPMPPAKFEEWREMVFTFSLKEVYGQ
ncbi:MAG: TonB C-terminal domain-containing protein [Minwuia sp.]|nr:TonB C-terminal domain-containing protein [Minwuia sp.]